MIRFPGVYAPQGGTRSISDAVLAEHMDASSQVLDLRSGRGAVSACAVGPGTGSDFTADISCRAAFSTWLSGQFHSHRIRVSCGDGTAQLPRRRYLESTRVIEPGQDIKEIVVIRARV
ncbi:hypothetical protein [Rhodococcus sp. IEGM 1379]|uniref:hypothetical protein n=1 Tax=Rhodococcus sp. IEGM 1379 TaxID=3047086 RepID=UPI0024B7FFB3|nr:hypothetical protein [Rhodococcus sp. IEGM 1379]MDI9913861.1 hypothetical protein [Rhodococcus sp. IEGM 1379]